MTPRMVKILLAVAAIILAAVGVAAGPRYAVEAAIILLAVAILLDA